MARNDQNGNGLLSFRQSDTLELKRRFDIQSAPELFAPSVKVGKKYIFVVISLYNTLNV